MARKAVKATEVKAAEVKAAEVKEVEVKETAKAEVVADKAEEKAAKKAPAKRVAKTTAKKVKEEAKIDIVLQYQTLEVSAAAVEEKVKAQFVADGNKATAIKTLNICLKPFENSAYYVINDDVTGRVDLF